MDNIDTTQKIKSITNIVTMQWRKYECLLWDVLSIFRSEWFDCNKLLELWNNASWDILKQQSSCINYIYNKIKTIKHFDILNTTDFYLIKKP